ncbi:hypothetical protein KSC_030530 [Ktedonobacter sp. SOSP1-52]|uniref:hypothetical protein n=1 Tax=Ktedonobacter sp. SOSP1-52 TaxID=2778366 RepID=UPI001914DBF0|nr:hypothetical protein [Ktedonobacter sp. SOSP1-52]GHO64161.1 hypothetical protein KSC_030530 [Ktedonobacter sp. SOSP1-52]
MEAIRYCKAYYLRDIRKFNHWADLCEQMGENLQDDDIVYVRDDFRLVRNPTLPDADHLLRSVTPEWQQFCQQVLQFSVPKESLTIAEGNAVTERDALHQGNG